MTPYFHFLSKRLKRTAPITVSEATSSTIQAHPLPLRKSFAIQRTKRSTWAFLSPSLVVYDWPSIARHWEELSFDEQSAFIDFLSSTVGERLGGRIPGLPPGIRWENNQYALDRVNASGSAVDGLIALVQQLVDINPRMTIMIVAHSMGSHVVVEALTRHAKDLSPVRRVILMAPDIDAAALQAPAFHSLSSLEALHVFYSANDKIIRLYSRVANLSFPRFGATGPAESPSGHFMLRPRALQFDVASAGSSRE